MSQQLRGNAEPSSADAIPIACNLLALGRERDAHLTLSVDVILRWPRARREEPAGFLFEYDGSEERFVALARWAASEHRCCPWASYSVEMAPFTPEQPGVVRLRVSASAEGVEFLRACYQSLETLRSEVARCERC